MMITKPRIDVILNRYKNLIDLVKLFANSKNKGYTQYGDDITFDFNNITWKVNTSCNCHPKMVKQIIGTVDKFIEWCKKHNY